MKERQQHGRLTPTCWGKEMKRLWQSGCLLLALAGSVLLGTPETALAQNTSSLSLSAFGGISNDPGGFDVFRESDFDAGFHFGGSLGMRLAPNIAVRGDVAFSRSSGSEGGVVNEDVEFDRTYYGFALEGRFPLGTVTPYVLGGGGFVTVHRKAPALTYEFTELAGRAGLGVAYPFAGAPIEAFAEASQWFYPRATTGEGLQWDTNVSIGLSVIPF